MQAFSLILAMFVAGACLAPTLAQQAGSSQHDKMLEVLRKQVAEERAKMLSAPQPAAPVAAPVTPPAPRQDQALEILRKKIAEERALTPPASQSAAAPVITTETPAANPAADQPSESPVLSRALRVLREAVRRERDSASGTETSASATSNAQIERAEPTTPAPVVTQPQTTPTPVTAQTPEASKTQQQRLAELLALYKADRITPLQYHEQRAKILAER